MDSRIVDRIKHVSNTEVVRRLLIEYFMRKGFQSFDRIMYPSLLQDLPMSIPILASKIEIVPHAVELDPALGKAVLGWNMFVLGSNRMYLGESYHNNLIDLARQIKTGLIRVPYGGHGTARRQTTPRRIVAFVTRVLGDHKAGYVDLNPLSRPIRPLEEPYRARGMMMGMPQQFFTRSGYGT